MTGTPIRPAQKTSDVPRPKCVHSLTGFSPPDILFCNHPIEPRTNPRHIFTIGMSERKVASHGQETPCAPKAPHIEGRIGQDGTIQPRDHDGGGIGTLREDAAHQIHTGLTRHIDVAQHQGIGSIVQLLARFPCIPRKGHGVAVRLQQIAKKTPDGLFIIDDENAAIIE